VFADRIATPRLLSCCFAALAAAGALTACGSSGSKSSGTSTTAAAAVSTSTQGSGSPAANSGCSPVSAPAPKGAQQIPRPSTKLSPAKRYTVSLITNCGTIDIQLDVKQAPKTASSFAYLVKRGFYNELTFHRIAAGFVIQGGDPNGDGSGGPGYTVVEPPPAGLRYTRGTVAMAKTGTDPSGASGSQFFIVTASEAPLPAQYALVGKIVGSFGGVDSISALPTNPPQDGAPTSPVVISSATLSTG
jgi:peptidyl-prolyl cis-trans isomerase B (cyclophilin B)